MGLVVVNIHINTHINTQKHLYIHKQTPTQTQAHMHTDKHIHITTHNNYHWTLAVQTTLQRETLIIIFLEDIFNILTPFIIMGIHLNLIILINLEIEISTITIQGDILNIPRIIPRMIP